MKTIFTTRRILLLILLFAALLRLYGIIWDQGFHLHPDERAIVMAVDSLQYPKDLTEFLSVDSPWNPKFFAYGSFPMYLLQFAGDKMAAVNLQFGEYSMINLVGRFLSAMFDLATIALLFFIGRKLFRPAVGLFAAFFYAISVLPIQLSHFYAVDTILTFFITVTLYVLLLFYEKPSFIKSLLLGLFFGLALATKVSAIVLFISIGTALFIDFLLLFIKNPHKPQQYKRHLADVIRNTFTFGVIITAAAFAAFILFEPYAFIDRKTFWEQTLYQSMMTKDAFVFPYTLQYVGKIPYLYELYNIFLFGLGPVLSVLCFLGIGYAVMQAVRKGHKNLLPQIIILFTFFLSYFWVVGGFAIGFMRYMLPVYPLLCLFGAVLAYQLFRTLNEKVKNKTLLLILSFSSLVLLLLWPLSFVQIYAHNNTRYDATTWMQRNIPPGKAIAIEHWDDGLPLIGQEQYVVITLGLYEPDTPEKWVLVKNQLEQTDYIIIASNRLYTPLQKLTNCAKLPPMKCYPQTTAYYQRLFSGQLGFEKVAEFENYPTVPFLNIPINDQAADESFTVYDHPKVMIFKKTGQVNL